MSVIQVSCTDQVMTLTNTPVIASGGVNENFIEFSFCSQWDGFAKVCAFYQQPGAYYHSLLDSTNRCPIPAEVCAAPGPMYFGVVGVKGDITRTSEVIKYKLVEGVMTEITDPTEDVYQQILAELVAIRELVANIEMPEDIVTSAQLREHTEDKNNPHGTTAEQLGAAPAGHTHTLEDLGAAAADHTHTPENLGAAAADHTHSLADLGAAAANHTHTPAAIGAATAKAVAATIATSAWSSTTKKATISVAGVTADTEETHVIPTPADRASKELWDEAEVFCDAQGNGTLTFSCETVPTGSITVNILIVGC